MNAWLLARGPAAYTALVIGIIVGILGAPTWAIFAIGAITFLGEARR